MRVAIASDDQITIAPHFGRTAGFLLFEVIEGSVEAKGYRPVSERRSHHERVLAAVGECDAVIASGIGAHMFGELHERRVDVLLTDVRDARTAIELFAAGSLPERSEICCA